MTKNPIIAAQAYRLGWPTLINMAEFANALGGLREATA